ncbi:hypothetical protein CEUSTIGMA_g7626.t1 [Chlamydomonas eustigma]|uniref:Uncharacterized protein n=1 Tax=Chlamydomonas eustigma TaxID=1157962 RepID=A0A250XAT0_9CHLO|nr:hypothetical protein CEUSTIGMA_g7626.t1 [Chlamydomonas eustigma]|eukprot:GAX80188.1 hypothetical protein CEUSTIGMA_g7626.t1 [Chlamydomonas eustigma]
MYLRVIKMLIFESQIESPLQALCRTDLTISDFFTNDLGQFTPCFIDLALLGIAHTIGIIAFSVHLYRIFLDVSRYKLLSGARAGIIIQAVASCMCALIPVLELNGRLGQASSDQEGPAPHEFAAAGLAFCSWSLLSVLLIFEAQQKYVPLGRWFVRFAVVLQASSEVVKLKMLIPIMVEDYFFYLYLVYVALQCFLTAMALCWWPAIEQMKIVHEGYMRLASSEPLPPPSSPEVGAGLLSKLTFFWLTPVLTAGAKAPLAKDQVPELPPYDKVDNVAADFERHWRHELSQPGSASLGQACWRTVRHVFLAALPLKIMNDTAQFTAPMLLSQLLKVIADKGAPEWEGYMWAGVMFVVSMAGLLADHQHFHLVMRAGMRLSGVLGAQVQSKVLRLTPAARSQFSSGRIFSLVTSDAETISSLCMNAFGLMSSPLRITVALYFLYIQLGISCLVTISCLVLMIPVNLTLMRLSSALLKAALTHSDERTKLEGEMVGGIEVVKCSGWETPFLSRVSQVRSKEIAMLWRVSLLNACILFILNSLPTIIPVATFSAYLLLGNNLSSTEAFVSLALFNVLRLPLFMLPQLMSQLTQARVSLGRLQEFLQADDLDDEPPLPPAKKGEVAVKLSGDFSWDTKGLPSLMDVNLEVPAGQLMIVVGSTGSGKTTLLSAMMGQMQQMYGPVPIIKGRLAYVPQAAFLINATIRENILFGLPYEKSRYDQCLFDSCLDTDLRMLAGGDMTELGDNGVNLSGGQRQRVSIARALYSNADVLLFDDPLSALDSKVGRRVFERAFKNSLQKAGKTVILATNQLYFVQAADQVVYMSQGKVSESGSFPQLMAAGGHFAAMLKEVQVEEEDMSKDYAEAAEVVPPAAAGSAVVGSAADIGDKSAVGAKLTSEETSAVGSISIDVIFKYINAMGGMFWFLLLFLGYIAVELIRLATTVWLSIWTGSTDASQASGSQAASAFYYLMVYAAISGGQVLAQFGNFIESGRLTLKAADNLHKGLLSSLLAAPMSFFHTTPIGRIVNRLTKDTADIDRQLGSNVGMALRSFLQLATSLLLMGWVAPLALPPLVVMMLAFYLLYTYFQATVRQVKRLEAVSRSPVLSSLTESISGSATIRAFCGGPRLIRRHSQLVDISMSNTHTSNSLSRWLGVRLESLGALATLCAAVVAVEQRGGASDAGLLLTYAMQLSILMSITLRVGSVVENNLNSVERVCEYISLPAEGLPRTSRGDGNTLARVAKAQEPPSSWPSQGEVEFKQVAMRYRPGLPLVLRGVSFKAAAKEKVGIVGRTGAGKSSMIGCLFRLTEVEGGGIEIDGVNISKIPLSSLRSKLALIPQVPLLFTGTIRINLSPFGLYSDAELWNALRRAHLAAVVEAWPAGLDTLLQEGGAPLSAGQKQLLALARAQLNPSRVLVLDEATANVDVETDAVIQRTMRTEFKDRTILAIAHRLHTIIDYDKVLVLDRGLVAEFGTPAALLSSPEGVFTSMVDDTGEATAKFLKGVAAGQVDLSESISAIADAGVERLLAAPSPEPNGNCILRQLMQPGVLPGQAMQGIAAQLLERSRAVTQLIKGVTDSIKKDILEEEHNEFEAEGLLEQATFGREDNSSSALTMAQRNLLLAFEVQLQVQQYAEAAIVAMKAQNELFFTEERAGRMPSNLQAMLMPASGSSRSVASAGIAPSSPSVEPPRPGGTGRASCDEVRGLLKELNKPCNIVSSGHVAGGAYAGEVSDATRRAAGMVRGNSMRSQRQDH